MKPILFSIFFGTYILIIFSDCKKSNPYSDNGLPPATQTGQGMFACRLNGKPWISRRGRPSLGANIIGDTTLTVGGSVLLSPTGQERLGIVIEGIYEYSKKNYTLNDTLTAYAVYEKSPGRECFLKVNTGFGDWAVKKVTGGIFILTKVDTVNKIVAGTFNFIVPTDFCDTLRITDGRFDIKYQ
jgi:hypothetical protein